MPVCKEDQFERSGEANVKDWGAIGDGQADDTDAFECAIAQVVSAPAGTYSHELNIIHHILMLVCCGCVYKRCWGAGK